MEGVTFSKTDDRKIGSAKCSVLANCFFGIDRTGWVKPTLPTDPRTEEGAVGVNKKYQDALHRLPASVQ
jgi:hypothetical protein